MTSTRWIWLTAMVCCISIFAHAQTASFTADHTIGCSPLPVTFTNTSTGATNYSWDFDNGSPIITTSSTTPITSFFTTGTYTVVLTAYNGASSDTMQMVITVPPLPTISFYATDTTLCPGDTVSFTNTTTGTGLTYTWDFGDGGTSTLANPFYAYSISSPGYHDVKLTVTTALGCATSLTKAHYMYADSILNPNIFASKSYFCLPPARDSFSSTTTGGTHPYTYSWDFGDGVGTSTLFHPVYIYTTTDTDTVTLTVTDAIGCSASKTKAITISQFYASFTTDTTICLGDADTFTNTSFVTAPSNTYHWFFGSTTDTASVVSPVHLFTAAGTCVVKLTTNNGQNCRDTVKQNITVLPPPTSDFTISPSLPCPPPTALTFTSSYSGSGTLSWIFGDGTTGTGATVTHTYTDAELDTLITIGAIGYNSYKLETISMLITDTNGCTNTVSHTDTIYDQNLTISSLNYHGCVPFTTTFSIADSTTVFDSVHPYPSPIVTYSWNFGDGSPVSTLASPSHTFTDTGHYYVSCTVTTANGCSKTNSGYLIKVGSTSHIIRYSSDTVVCPHDMATFAVFLTSGSPTGIDFLWGDGTDEFVSPILDPEIFTGTHSWVTPGWHHVLIYGYQNGCDGNVINDSVFVDSGGAAIHYASTCNPINAINFYNASYGSDSSFWTVSDGATSTTDTFTHTFTMPFSGTITLHTENTASGCRDSMTIPVTLDSIRASFYGDDTAICAGQTVHFTAVDTMGASTNFYYKWLINGTAVATIFEDYIWSHTFDTGGAYTVGLVLYDGTYGCPDTFTYNNYVTVGHPNIHFTVAPEDGCAPLSVVLTDASTDAPGTTFTNYIWIYGDGRDTFCVCPVMYHTYTLASTAVSAVFTDTVIVTDNIGCTDTLIAPHEDSVLRVKAVFTTNQHICLGTTSFFSNTSAFAFSDGHTYSWSFGDGGTSTLQFPIHTYADTGTYTVVLTATDTVHGCTSVDSVHVNVSKPVASFTMSDSAALCAPLVEHFTSTSWPATGDTLHWNFGNGSTSLYGAPVATYSSSGIYTVTLVVVNAYGCKDTATANVSVFGYSGDFTYTTSGCNPLTAHFYTLPFTGADSATWLFGDGNSATAAGDSFTYTYTHPGMYVPTLILGAAATCHVASLGADTIRVDSVGVSFTATPNPVCPNTDITFSGTGTSLFSTITHYEYHFNGTDSTYLNPVLYSYPLSGSYPVTLTATDGWGCHATATDTISVSSLPGPIVGIDSLCYGDSYVFTDTTVGGDWESEDPTIALAISDGTVIGVGVGTTTISYTVTNVYGCTTINTFPITILPLPDPGVISGADSVCLGGATVLTETLSSGTWGSFDATIASVDASGTVSGIALGSTYIYYVVSDGFCTNGAIFPIRVVTVPAVPPIDGLDTVCAGGTAYLSDTVTGGYWYSYDPTIADVDPVTGMVTGYTVGSTIIAYDVTNDCGTTEVTIPMYVIPLEAPITGVLSVCSGSSTPLFNIVAGGTWSISDESVATIDPVTGVLTGVTTGTATVTYTGTSVCGYYFDTAVINVNTPPYITTNFMVACQTLSSTKTGPVIISGLSGCIQVCDSTVMRYYANGVASSVFTWIVAGGTIVGDYGDSIDVLWPAAGITGSITLSDTFSHCVGSVTVCIQVISKPHALFTASAINLCLGGSVVFTNLSTADPLSPIVSYFWNFGDGTGSAETNPIHYFTSGNPNDTVTLVVKNACNCSDTFRIVVSIAKDSGAVISCPSIVCEGQMDYYSIPDNGCSPINWSVEGGGISSGAGTDAIKVKWTSPDPDGFGYVSVSDPCSACPDTTTVKIPIILINAAISGPDTICTKQEYEYSLPLWPATQYMWGVLGDPTAKVGPANDYKLIVNFSTPGPYTLHGWYQNDIKLCGGNVFRDIYVVPSVPIVGPTTVCPNELQTYTIDGSTVASWILSDAYGTVVSSSTGANFHYTFTTQGNYTLTATGPFCASPLMLTVFPGPGVVDSVHGQDTVCMHRVYTYTAFSDVPGTIYNWTAVGGTVSPASGSPVVTAIWAADTGMELIVTRTSTVYPYCPGPPLHIKITRDSIHAPVYGDTSACANSYRDYFTTYTHGEVYDWSIFPTTAGSVVSGEHGTAASILWNNITTGLTLNAYVILTVHRCDSVVRDTLRVKVHPSPAVSMNIVPNPACPGTPVSFTSAVGGASYIWHFGDGSGLTTTTNVVSHAFPDNITTGNESYEVSVTVLPDATASCPVSGTASKIEYILPGPVAFASTADPSTCNPVTIVGTVTDNVGGLVYQWFNGSLPLAGGTSPSLTTSLVGTFHFIVMSSNGCKDTSNLVSTTPCGNDTIGCGGLPTPSAEWVSNCNTITLFGIPAGGTSPTWTAISVPLSGITIVPGTVASYSYNYPGIYTFIYDERFGPSCDRHVDVIDTIGLIPNYTFELHCASGGYDSVFLEDHSVYLPGWEILNVYWQNVTTGSIIAVGWPYMHIALPAPGTYIIREFVTYAHGFGPPQTCSFTDTFTLPGAPHATFTMSMTTVCSGVPVDFTPTNTAGLVHYFWSFGDGTSSLIDSAQKVYTLSAADGDPSFRNVVLTVTDSIGCTADTSESITIRKNLLSGISGDDTVLCLKDAPVQLYFHSTGPMLPSSYLWSTGATTDTITVDTSGAYWITVYGPYQCQMTTAPTTAVNIIRVPPNAITGHLTYCEGDTVRLYSTAGNGANCYWYINGADDATGTFIADGGLSAGTYVYQLVTTVTDSAGSVSCADTAADTVHIYPMPAPPTITGPTALNCDMYQISLTASEPEAGTYNWSDGTMGATDNSIFTGGTYKVWFTDVNGCQSSATAYVPMSPAFYFQYFPSGCYTLCSDQFPLTLYGPPGVVFNKWQWLENDSVVSTGVSSVVAAYTAHDAATYNWTLDNGLCTEESPDMDLSMEKCSACGASHFNAVVTCTPGNPASFKINIIIVSPPFPSGTTFTISTDMGPITPFTGTMPGTTPYGVTLTYTTLTIPAPPAITVKILFLLPDGTKCFLQQRVNVPACSWEPEKPAPSDSTQNSYDGSIMSNLALIANAMLVYPNPATGTVTVAYDYGTDAYSNREIAVYDEMGRKIIATIPQSVHDNWTLNTDTWSPGIYIIRMEGDGKALQTQRLVVTH